MGVKKYFIAIIIPSGLYEKVESIKEQLFKEHELKGALRSPAHITLHRPFEWKEEKEEILIQKLKEFDPKVPFDIKLKNFAAFEPRVIYVNVVENNALTVLQNDLKKYAQRELRIYNEVNDLRGFHPHVTVASRDLKKNKFCELWPDFEKRTIEGTFNCNGFSLLKLDEKWRELQYFSGNSSKVQHPG